MLDSNGPAGGSHLMNMSTSMRVINRARVLLLIRRQPGLPRAEISRLTGLSKATVSDHISEMLQAGLLHQDLGAKGQQRNAGLHINRAAGVAVGIELGPEE